MDKILSPIFHKLQKLTQKVAGKYGGKNYEEKFKLYIM